jgi:hypothetical protein
MAKLQNRSKLSEAMGEPPVDSKMLDEINEIINQVYEISSLLEKDYFIAMNFVFHTEKPDNDEQIICPNNKDILFILKRLTNLNITKLLM